MQIVTPCFEGMVDRNFHRLYDFASQGKYFRLTFGGHETAHTAFNGTGEGGHKIFVVIKFERNAFDGFFVGIGYGEQQHGSKVHVGLIHGNGLEVEFNGAILNGNTAVYGFY